MSADESLKSILKMQEIIATLDRVPLTPAEITVMAGSKNRASYYAWKGGRTAPKERAVLRLEFVLDMIVYLSSLRNRRHTSSLLRNYFTSAHTVLDDRTPIEFIRQHGNTDPSRVMLSIRQYLSRIA